MGQEPRQGKNFMYKARTMSNGEMSTWGGLNCTSVSVFCLSISTIQYSIKLNWGLPNKCSHSALSYCAPHTEQLHILRKDTMHPHPLHPYPLYSYILGLNILRPILCVPLICISYLAPHTFGHKMLSTILCTSHLALLYFALLY